jgi:ethanolamine utilization protein EutA
VVDPGQRIRATVIGASQFSAQLSGNTIHLSGLDALPLRNVPVVRLGQPLADDIDPDALAAAFERRAARQDVDTSGPVALAFSWSGLVGYPRLAAVARAIARVAGSAGRRDDADNALIVVVDADVGEYLDPPGALPVLIKSLLFAAGVGSADSRAWPVARSPGYGGEPGSHGKMVIPIKAS